MARQKAEQICDYLFEHCRGKSKAIDWADLLNDLIERNSRGGKITDRKWLEWSDALARTLKVNQRVLRQDSQCRIYWRIVEEEAA